MASADYQEAWLRLIKWLERHVELAEERGMIESTALRAVLAEMNDLAPVTRQNDLSSPERAMLHQQCCPNVRPEPRR